MKVKLSEMKEKNERIMLEQTKKMEQLLLQFESRLSALEKIDTTSLHGSSKKNKKSKKSSNKKAAKEPTADISIDATNDNFLNVGS